MPGQSEERWRFAVLSLGSSGKGREWGSVRANDCHLVAHTPYRGWPGVSFPSCPCPDVAV